MAIIVDWPIGIKRTEVPGRVPDTTVLTTGGQLAANTADKKLFIRSESGSVVQLGVAPGDLATVAFSGSYDDLLDKPNISGEYVLPAATDTTLGGVKVGAGLGVQGDGTISANVLSINSRTGAVTLTATDVGLPTDLLDGTQHIALKYLPSSITGALKYQGTYDAATNTPTLVQAEAANEGWLYIVSVAGTVTPPGQSQPLSLAVGDWLLSNGTEWQVAPAVAGDVLSVNGQTGNVTLDATTLPGLAAIGRTGSYNDLQDKPTTFPPEAHRHPTTQIDGLATVATTGSYNDLLDLPPNPNIANVGLSASETPALTQEVQYAFTRRCQFDANFAGSVCYVSLYTGTGSTIRLLKNGTQIGTITTDTATGTFSVAGTTIFEPGDRLGIQWQTANVASATINFQGRWV